MFLNQRNAIKPLCLCIKRVLTGDSGRRWAQSLTITQTDTVPVIVMDFVTGSAVCFFRSANFFLVLEWSRKGNYPSLYGKMERFLIVSVMMISEYLVLLNSLSAQWDSISLLSCFSRPRLGTTWAHTETSMSLLSIIISERNWCIGSICTASYIIFIAGHKVFQFSAQLFLVHCTANFTFY